MHLSIIRKILPLLFVLILFSNALADVVPSLDGTVRLETLPMDDYTVGGPNVDTTIMGEDGYSDPSITIQMVHEWVGSTRYNVAYVTIAHPSQLRTAMYNDAPWRTNFVLTISAQKNALVSVGGEFLSYNKETYTIRMGQTLRTNGYANRDALFIDQNGDFHITKGFTADTLTELQDQGLQIINLFNFGPALIMDGKTVCDSFTYKCCYPVGDPQNIEPRTAIGQIGPLQYMMVVVDGRRVRIKVENGKTRASKGATLSEVADYMLEHGCTQAYTLDGDGSAIMCYANKIYSKPSSSRVVSDIVYFTSLSPAQTDTN